MTDANVLTGPVDFEHAGARLRSVGKHAGAELLGATAYELEPGARWAELHAHYANEELIVVLEGTPTLHTLDGSRELVPGVASSIAAGAREDQREPEREEHDKLELEARRERLPAPQEVELERQPEDRGRERHAARRFEPAVAEATRHAPIIRA